MRLNELAPLVYGHLHLILGLHDLIIPHRGRG